MHVLEHVPDDAAAMRELARVLRPDGLAVVMVPAHGDLEVTDEDPSAGEDERLRRFGQADHVRRYGTDLRERLGAAGFDVTVVDYLARLGPGSVRRYGLGGGPLYTAYSR
jgi:SAM-dependent methyltransferase